MFSKFIPHASLVLTAALAATAMAADQTSATAAAATVAATTNTSKADAAKGKKEKSATDAKALSGMSIVGNQEAPKALVIVPWKSSQLGDSLGIAKTLDDSRQPVDKEVFMRELAYYEIRSKSQ